MDSRRCAARSPTSTRRSTDDELWTGDRPLTEELAEAAATLDLAPADLDAVLRRARQRQRRRRRLRGSSVVVIVVLAATIGAVNRVGREDRLLVSPPLSTASSSTTVPPAPALIPPVRPVPAALADPSPIPNQFPLEIEQYNERVGANLRHRSGGPYLAEAEVRARAFTLARCDSDQQQARCDGIVVQLFDSYARAYEAYGPPVWQYSGGFGHDREVYLVTVYGALPFCPRGPMLGMSCPLYRDHDNLVIDATTGEAN